MVNAFMILVLLWFSLLFGLSLVRSVWALVLFLP